MNFYAYLQARPTTVDAFGIFYVGKGFGRRAMDLTPRNAHHAAVVKKHGVGNIVVGAVACSSEEIAFQLEVGLIKCLRRMGVDLTNKTNGGDGVSGYKHTDKFKKQHSEFMRGKKYRKGQQVSEITKRQISETLKRTTPWTGRSHTAEAKAKMGVCRGLVWVNNGNHKLRVEKHLVPEYVSQGFTLGMKLDAVKKKVSGAPHGCKGYRTITNGITTRYVRPDEVLPEGWRFGRHSRKVIR